ncbi:peptide ABC transporter permease [Sphaerisporangium krabiense]|uniref:Peptide/nickel transport system permease protein n=1 Tax=Sphaerisporangium krabiense TaxID=763782 RepID=A0A7W8Z5N5_9ACTN|nr:ABC transporter permease [Sphaerisporangium krabiense]MBB5627598.1 peptide/nickel transport system permease protein [Sphaerisporangium krabiense]GII66612.1 peptide ABC transporter permease [Sphaerisporangium krabiense]
MTALAGEAAAAPARAKRPSFARRNPALVVSGGLLGLIIVLVVVLPFFLPDPEAIDPVQRLLPPSLDHLMGTDRYGRDLFSRWASAGRVSIGMTLLITVCAVSIGTFIGLVAGYFTRVGRVIMRVVDAWMAFPSIILAIVFGVVIGPGMTSELIAVTIIFTPYTARIIRSRVLGLATRTYVKAARVSGMGPWKTLAVHILPNTLPLAVVQCVLLSAGAMLIDGSLSFLGLGISPPTATWGNMVSDGRVYLQEHPTMVLFPGLAIALFVFLLNVAGASLRTFVDPRAKLLFAQQRRRGRAGGR